MLERDPALLSHAARAAPLPICVYCVHSWSFSSPSAVSSNLSVPPPCLSHPSTLEPASDLLDILFLSRSQCVFLMWSCRKSSFTQLGSLVV